MAEFVREDVVDHGSSVGSTVAHPTYGSAPGFPIITVQQFPKHTSRESGVTTASLTCQDDPPAHLCGRHEPTIVHYRVAEQARFRLSRPVLRWNATRKVLPEGTAGEAGDPEDELAVAAQQRLGWRALSPTVALPAGRRT